MKKSLRQFWIFPIFGLLFFLFFYLSYGREKFESISFYAWLWAAAHILLLGLLIYIPSIKKGLGEAIPDFDEPMGFRELILSAFIGIMVWVIMAFFQPLINLKLPRMNAYFVPLALTPAIYNPLMQFAWHLFIVAWSEEILAYVLYFIGLIFPVKPSLQGWIGAVFSRSVWAIFHLLRNPQISSHPILILPAFFAGLAFYWLLKQTKSLPAVAVSHGVFVNFVSQIT